MNRDRSSHEDASARLNSQLPISEKVLYADTIIDNSGSPKDLEAHVDSFVQRLEKEVSWLWRLSWLCPPFGLLSAQWTLVLRALRRSIFGMEKGKVS